MKRGELIKQLKSLKDVEPRTSWKEETRLVLMRQIVTDKPMAEKIGLVKKALGYLDMAGYLSARFLRRAVMQPVGIGALALVAILGSGSFAVNASLDSLPGEYFYTLKRTSENMQLALTRDQERKAKLALEFANRRLQEINRIQAKPSAAPVQKERVTQAMNTFNQQLEEAKNQIKQLGEKTKDETANKDQTVNEVELNKPIQEHLLYTERKIIEIEEAKKKQEEANLNNKESSTNKTADAVKAGEEDLSKPKEDEPATTAAESADPILSAQAALKDIKIKLSNKELGAALEQITASQEIVAAAQKDLEQPAPEAKTDQTETDQTTEPSGVESTGDDAITKPAADESGKDATKENITASTESKEEQNKVENTGSPAN